MSPSANPALQAVVCGPALSMLKPPAVTEMVCAARDHAGPHGRPAVAAGPVGPPLPTALGIVAASTIIWPPTI